jgi:two-component system, OmpR family, sensor kinase
MTLASRVSLFFLASLALVLAGFSTALYLLVHVYLDHQVDQQLGAMLATLSAATEINKDEVEWEPLEHMLPQGANGSAVRWAVRGARGGILDHSVHQLPEDLLSFGELFPESAAAVILRRQGAANSFWRVGHLRLQAPTANWPPAWLPNSGNNKEDRLQPFLVLTAAVPLDPVEKALRLLLATLAGLSLGLWLLAAMVGGWLCRRTLAPVAQMAESARAIPATQPDGRLEVSPTGDELEELGRAFNELLDRLQESFERQRHFTGEASHQLRTPLTVMLGQVEVALRRERSPEDYRRVLEVVAEQADRLRRIVEMLLFLARADSEAALPGLERLCLRTWLEQHLKEWANHPRAEDLHWQLSEGGDWHVQAHPPLLGQVVDLLLDNACKYSRPGTPVTLSLRKDGSCVGLDVEDRGCGILAEDLAHVFEPFFRSPRQLEPRVGGVGLGLTIARRVAEALGGRVEVVSQPGQGSRFSVRLQRGSVDP